MCSFKDVTSRTLPVTSIGTFIRKIMRPYWHDNIIDSPVILGRKRATDEQLLSKE